MSNIFIPGPDSLVILLIYSLIAVITSIVAEFSNFPIPAITKYVIRSIISNIPTNYVRINETKMSKKIWYKDLPATLPLDVIGPRKKRKTFECRSKRPLFLPQATPIHQTHRYHSSVVKSFGLTTEEWPKLLFIFGPDRFCFNWKRVVPPNLPNLLPFSNH